MKYLQRALREDSGATMVEYAILAALIAGVCILVVTAVGSHVSHAFNSANSSWGG